MYITIKNTLFEVKEIVARTKKIYILRLFGLRETVSVRRNGKDCRFYKQKPLYW